MDDKGNIRSLEEFRNELGEEAVEKLITDGKLTPIERDQEGLVRKMTWRERMNWLTVQKTLRDKQKVQRIDAAIAELKTEQAKMQNALAEAKEQEIADRERYEEAKREVDEKVKRFNFVRPGEDTP
jgi:chromosome condensin MukBEF ATPase and DNA-binding subunit MukB